MNIHAAIFILFACALRAHSETFDWGINNINSISNYFDETSRDMKAFLNSKIDAAVEMKQSVNSYFEEKQQQLTADFNSYMGSVKQSKKKVIDSWSYLKTEDNSSRMENPDVTLSVPSIIAKNGYACETHIVVSQGYILNLHRIPRPKSGGEVSSRTVLLQHGLFACSADWILNGPEKGLAYVLADAGYDVWMTNIRGNKYSREHAWLKSDSKHYWNFSWHDVAEHDIPAIIDHIRNIKGPSTKIVYIGHSMGTTILFTMLSLRPEYNDILSAGIAMAPVVYTSDIKSPLKALSPIASNVAYMEMLYGSHEFLPKNSALGRMTSACKVDSLDSILCKNVIFYLCGANEKQFNKTILPLFLSDLGTGTSWKTVVHFAQEMVAGGKFQQFDYGTNHNNEVYGQDTPTEYNLKNVTLPIKLFWAQNDLLSSEKDVLELHKAVPSTEMVKIDDPEFNHVDYLWAIEAPRLVNKPVLDTLERVLLPERTFSAIFKFT